MGALFETLFIRIWSLMRSEVWRTRLTSEQFFSSQFAVKLHANSANMRFGFVSLKIQRRGPARNCESTVLMMHDL
jgi:hypothetical protein